MNLTAAITELKARGGSYLSDARCTIFLNDAKNAFEDFWYWPWLEETITGVAPLEIADLRSIIYTVDSTRETVLYGTTSNDVIMQESWQGSTEGDPVYWYLDGDSTMSVFPANTTSTLTVRYTRFSPELSGTDTPLIPTRYHSLWIDLAMVRVYRDADDHTAADKLEQRAIQRLGQLVAEYEVRNRQNTTTQQIFNGADW